MTKKLTFFIILLISFLSNAQNNNFWQSARIDNIPKENIVDNSGNIKNALYYSLNENQFIARLKSAPKRQNSSTSSVIIQLPNSKGGFNEFELFEVQTLAPALADKYPGIKSYVGVNSKNKTEKVTITLTPQGVNAKISTQAGSTSIIPITTTGFIYKVFDSNDALTSPFNCEFEDIIQGQGFSSKSNNNNSISTIDDSTLRTYRFAAAVTAEYSDFFITRAGLNSGTDAQKKAVVLAAMTVSLDRINSIVENDLAIRFEFIATTDNYIFLDATTDPYSDFDPINNYNLILLTENATYLDGAVGNANYDIGHVFSIYPNSLPGGVANLSSLCSGSNNKAAGVTTANIPEGELFNMIFAHEIGHQLGATHSYNNACSGNRSDVTAYETGSGITIMGYAGICPPNVIVPDDRVGHYHAANIIQMANHINNNSPCGQTTTITNSPPNTTPLTNYTIPKSTPFALDIQATDANGDNLTYNWEQYDKEISTQPPLATALGGPNFRGYDVSTSSIRYFPRLEDVLIGEYEPLWEVLPSVARDLNFVVTVRDNNPLGGQVVQEFNTLTVDDTAGPFRVTSQPGVTFFWETGSNVDITWDVANTDNVSGVNSQLVDIYLSTDGGVTFNTLLADDTPNDGLQSITVPNTLTTNARVMVRSADNVFFDINEATIEITNSVASCLTPQDISLEDISTNSANISWFYASASIPTAGTDYYLVTNGLVPDSATAPTGSFSSATTSTIFNNLLPNTTYDLYLRSNCGGVDVSNWSNSLNFTTDCDAIPAPYIENFDGLEWTSGFNTDTIDDCWRRNPNNPFDNYGWRVRSSTLNSNTGPSIDISGSGNFILAHASGYDDYSEAILEMPSINLSTLSIPNLKFSYHMFGNSMGTLKVQVKEISSSSYTDVFLISGQQQTSSNDSFIQETIDLNAFANQTINVRFIAIRGENFTSDIALDEVKIEETSECAVVENLSSSNETLTSFDLSWDTISAALDGYEWVVMADGINPNTGTPVVSGNVATGVTTTQISGLSPQTDYDVYVRADCDGLGFGDWSEVLEINLDYCEAGALVNNNIRFTNVTFNTINNSSGTGTNGSGYSDYRNISTIVNKLQGYHLNTTANFYGANSRLNVWIDYNQNGNFTDAGEHVIVNVTDTAIQNAGLITIPATASLGSTVMRLRIVNADPAAPPINNTPCGNSTFAEVEDYTIVIEENCLVVENLVATNTTLSSFDLSWDNSPTEQNGYEWVVMADGVAPDTTNAIQTGTVATSTNTVSITGLSSNTNYDVYVRGDCGTVLGVGEWSHVLDVNLYYCVADVSQPTTIHITNTTFNTINSNSTEGINGFGYSDLTTISSTVNIYQSYAFGISSNFNNQYNRVNIWIDYNQNGVFTDPGEQVVNNLTGSTSFNGAISIPATASIGATTMRVRLDNTTSGFVANDTPCGNSGLGEIEDYTLIIEENCLVVENLVATNTTLSSFDLSWDNSPTEQNGYEWVVMADGVAPDTTNAIQTGTAATSTNTVSITGLTAQTDYDVYVRANCDALGLGDWSNVLEINLDYCDAGQSATFNNIHFTNVTFNTINNSSGNGTNGDGYSDYTTITTNVNKLQGYHLNTTAYFYGPNVRLNVWIDYNQNGDFTDAGEHVIVNVSDTAIQNAGLITIPATATLGSTVMRLRIVNADPAAPPINNTPCGNSTFAEVEDYTIVIEENCLVVENLVATNTTLSSFDLSWDNSPTEQNGYEWVVMADSVAPDTTNAIQTGTVGTGITTTSITGLSQSVDYDVYVRANCDALGLGDWSNVLEINLDYCDAGALVNNNIHFTNITFNTINNSSGPGTNGSGYSDYTAITTNVNKLQGYHLNTTANFYGLNVRLNVWIDYNQNGNFTDAGEHVIVNVTDTAIQNAGLITIPATASLGSTVMRLRVENADPNFSPINNTPCGDAYLSEVEDYTIVIENPCEAPTNPIVTNITTTSADLNWSASATETGGYEWVVMASGITPTVAGAEATGSVGTNVLTVSTTGLAANTAYDAYVRTNCGSGTLSDWSIVANFTTISCNAPTNLSVSNITADSANLSWDAVTNESGGYEYVLFTDSTIPNASTTPAGSVATGVITVDLTNLTAGTNHNVYVRTNCGNGILSDWSNVASFNTLSLNNKALNFDGVNDFVSLGNISQANFGTGDFTIELWVKPDIASLGSASPLIAKRDVCGIDNFWNLKINTNNTFFFEAIDPSASPNSLNVTSTSVLNNGSWKHIAVVRQSNILKLYVDGVEDVSQNVAPLNLSNTYPVQLGRDACSDFFFGDYFKGEMDEVRLWNTARSATEILNTRNTELVGNETGLFAYYTFDEGLVGLDNTGTIAPEIVGLNCSDYGTMNGFAKIGTTSNWVAGNPAIADATQTPQVEINVQGGNPLTDISDGSATFSAANFTEFGSVDVGSSNTFTYTIQNTTAGTTLTISDIIVNGSESADFAISNFTTNTTVAGNATTTFDVTFTPSTEGIRNATISINNDDCNEGNYDFAIQGSGVIPCSPPLNPSVSNITTTSADLSWDAVTSEIDGYQYVLFTDATVPDGSTMPTGSVATGIINASLSGLLSSTTYNAYVRTNCGSGILSDWSLVVSFTTLSCNAPINLTTSNITTSSADLSWDAVTNESGGYEYVLITDGSTPNGATVATGSVATNVTTVNLTGLSEGTDYDAYVRTSCSGGNLSGWSIVVSFSTGSLPTTKALNFDGLNDYINLGPEGNALNSSTALTIEVWYYPTQNNRNWSRILDFGNTTDQFMFLTSSVSNTGIPRFAIKPAGLGESVISAPSALPLNTWSHIAVTLTGTSATMYINGTQVAQNTVFNANPADVGTTNNNWIGRSQFFADAYLQGNLDELRIWNVARTASEIQNNLNTELVGNESGLVAYYTFDEGTSEADNLNITAPEIIAHAGCSNGTMNGFAKTGSASNWVFGSGIITEVTQTPKADINVQGGNPLTDISDGSATFSAANFTEFGSVDVGSSNTFTYTIQNTTAGTTLTISDIIVNGSESADFAISNFTTNTTVAGNATTTFDVTFTPSTEGIRNATISINNDDCNEGNYDFAIQGSGVIPCSPPLNPSVSNITTTSADLSWDAVTSEIDGYQYVLFTDATVPDGSTMPTGSVATGIINASLSGLLSSTTYNAYVRTNCGSGILSDWSLVVSFTTLSCNAPINLTTSNITTTSADLSWDAVTNESGGYEYVLFTDGSTPNGTTVATGSVATNVTTVNLTGLTENTTYNAYVRTNCGSGTLSDWSLVTSFTTLQTQNATALNFDGNSDYVALGPVIPANSSYTKEAWIYPENLSGAKNILSSQRSPFWLDNGILTSSNNFATASVNNITSPSPISLNTWTHVAVTWDGTTMKLYVNGSMVQQETGHGAYVSEDINISLYFNANYFDGTMDEVRIWNVARTASEIASNKDNELFGNETGLIAYYNFNNGIVNANNAGLTTLTDQTSNGNDGTLNTFGLTGLVSNWVDGSSNGISPAFCNVPTNLLVANITTTTANLTWDAATSEVDGYQYVLITDGTTPVGSTQETGSVHTGTTSINLTGLTIGTNYNAYVRTNCGSSNFSDWSAVLNFQTLPIENTAFQFNGNGYIDATASTATLLPVGNTARSVEFSVKTTQANLGNVVSWGSRVTAQRSSFAVRNGKASFTGESRDVIGTVVINDDMWHDITITYDGTNRAGVKIYVDGVLDPGPYSYLWTNASDVLNTTDQDLVLGRNAVNVNSERYVGVADDIRVWNRELTATEVANFSGLSIPATTPNLVAYFKFEDAPGNVDNSGTGNDISVAQDATGNYNGTLTNFPRTGDFGNWINRTVATCNSPINLSVANITHNSADLSWDAVINESGGYEYILFTDTTIPVASTTGTSVNGLMVNFNTLTPSTTYNFYVRTNCGGSNLSDWSTVISFTTLAPCDAPINLSFTYPTKTSVTLSWDPAASESEGYDYVLITDGTIPDASTTATGNVSTGITTVDLSGLNPATVYEAYVRTNCGGGIKSGWSMANSFTTYANPTIVSSSIVQMAMGTATPNSNAIIELSSKSKGFMPPKMTAIQRNAIAFPASGLIIFCTDCGANGELQIYSVDRWTNMLGAAAAPAP